MEDAARIAYRELINWLVSDYKWDKYEAYFFLTQAGTCTARQHGRSEIHTRCFDLEIVLLMGSPLASGN